MAAFTPVSAGRVLLGTSFNTFAFLSFLSQRELMVLWDQHETKGLFGIVTLAVSSAAVTGTFFSLCVIMESIKKPGPVRQIILLSAQPLCEVSYVYCNFYANFCHRKLN